MLPRQEKGLHGKGKRPGEGGNLKKGNAGKKPRVAATDRLGRIVTAGKKRQPEGHEELQASR
jgi:hypothetical protein